ncbi:hypothetical protein C9974_12165 [Marinobacter sp. B9-2]|nr:hypothetical protein C9974_12165 [Marinobacter sp. B9-2]
MPSSLSATLSPMVYVAAVSDFTLPVFEAVMTRRPSHVLLLVSEGFNAAREGAVRLQAQLEKELPGIRVHRSDTEPSDCKLLGQDFDSLQTWISRVLVPMLERPVFAGLSRRFNMTGGTKAMSLALATGLHWDRIDYKPDGQAALQEFCLDTGQFPGDRAIHRIHSVPLFKTTPLQVALLYNNDAYQDPENRISLHPGSTPLAIKIEEALTRGDAGLKELFAALERLWGPESGHGKTRNRPVTVSWQEFLGDKHAPSEHLTAWLEAFQRLAPEVITMDQQGVTLPTRNSRSGLSKDFMRWVSGHWLEQLADHWLQQQGVPASAIVRNLKVGRDHRISESQRETDLLIYWNGQATLVEVKADLPPGGKPSDLERQVSSLQQRFGKTRKVLLTGPQLKQKLEPRGSWERFAMQCATASVLLCWDKASFWKAVT